MRVEWTSSAGDVVEQVAAAVRDLQRGQPLRRVYVLTPPGSTAATLRRLLPATASGATRGIAGIRFTTVPDLALELAPSPIRAKRPMTPLLLSSAVQAQLDQQCPPALADVRHHPATVDALVQVANRLRSIRLADSAHDVMATLAGRSAVRRGIVDVAVRARAALVEHGFRDEASVLLAASDALADGVARLPGPLVVVVTDAVHPAQVPFLERLIASTNDVRIVAASPEPADVDFIAQLRRLTGAEPQQGSPRVPTRVVSSPDQDEEARWVVRRIVGLVTAGLQASPIVPEDIVVLYPPGSGYARSLREELDRAGMFSSGPAIETLAGSMAGQVVRLLIDLMLAGCDRDQVLHLVSVAPVWPTDHGHRRNVARWRTLCRQANIVVADDWCTAVERLQSAQFARRLRRRRYEPSIDVDVQSDSDISDQRSMESLVSLVASIQRSAASFIGARSWEAASRALLHELARHIGTLQWRGEHWTDVPVWQRRAAEQIEVVLTALRQFDEPATALSFNTASLRRIVAAELDQPVRKAGDTTVGVRLLPLQHGCCVDARHCFIVGANEGVLPPGRTEDLVVPGDLPAVCSGVLEHGDWQRSRLRRAWHAVLCGDAQVTVTMARTDLRRGGELFASLWVADAAVTSHASHADGVLNGAALTAGECAARRSGDADSASASATLHRRALALASRSQSAATVFDGLIGAHPETDPYGRAQAITSFESHANCGLQYFVTKVLGVSTDVDASEITEIQARERGVLVHLVLEQLVLEWLDTPPDHRPRWMQQDHLAHGLARAGELLDAAARRLDADHKLGHSTSWAIERRMIMAAVTATLERDAREAVVPVAVEYHFGGIGDLTELHHVQTSGDPVAFHGSIDRIDIVGGVLRVTDFKTSNAANARSTGKAEIEAGSKLQPSLYSAVVAAQAAVLSAQAGHPPVTAIGWQYVYLRRGRSEVKALTRELLDILEAPVGVTAARLANGDFTPAIAGEYGCPICTPDGLGRGDVDARVQQWNAFEAERLAALEQLVDDVLTAVAVDVDIDVTADVAVVDEVEVGVVDEVEVGVVDEVEVGIELAMPDDEAQR